MESLNKILKDSAAIHIDGPPMGLYTHYSCFQEADKKTYACVKGEFDTCYADDYDYLRLSTCKYNTEAGQRKVLQLKHPDKILQFYDSKGKPIN